MANSTTSNQGKTRKTVEIYAASWCSYCTRAKVLLDHKNVDFNEIDVTTGGVRKTEMIERSGRRTVPQIFINDRHIGGHDDLVALDQAGVLDQLLAQRDVTNVEEEGVQ